MDFSEVGFAFSHKWTREIADFGYTMIPNLVIRHISVLGMTPTEFLVFAQIESYRWNSKYDPYPRVDTIAKSMGVDPRTVTRTVTSMEDKGLIQRIKRSGTSNEYSIEPLIYKIEEVLLL